jgi:predicted TIM-barrel fold metal-dependent hydrolase
LIELAKLRCPISFDHLAFMKTADGAAQPAFQTPLDLLQDGNTQVKLSGAYRVLCVADRYDNSPATGPHDRESPDFA